MPSLAMSSMISSLRGSPRGAAATSHASLSMRRYTASIVVNSAAGMTRRFFGVCFVLAIFFNSSRRTLSRESSSSNPAPLRSFIRAVLYSRISSPMRWFKNPKILNSATSYFHRAVHRRLFPRLRVFGRLRSSLVTKLSKRLDRNWPQLSI